MALLKEYPRTNTLVTGIIISVVGFACTAHADHFVFSESFDSSAVWGMHEQFVDTSCYVDSAGEVTLTDAYVTSGKCLSVFSNKGDSAKSNHVIANYQLFNRSILDSCTYSVSACIDTLLDSGQTGPEFSVQNTRLLLQGQYRTFTAAIQYVPNPWVDKGNGWNIWNNGGWMNFLDLKLERGKWYQFNLSFDYITNRYKSLKIEGPDIDTAVNLGAYTISGDSNGFTEQALWLTVEAENLETACQGTPRVTQYRVFYDNVLFEMLTPLAVQNMQNRGNNCLLISKSKVNYYNCLGQRIVQTSKSQNISHFGVIIEQQNGLRAKCILGIK